MNLMDGIGRSCGIYIFKLSMSSFTTQPRSRALPATCSMCLLIIICHLSDDEEDRWSFEDQAPIDKTVLNITESDTMIVTGTLHNPEFGRVYNIVLHIVDRDNDDAMVREIEAYRLLLDADDTANAVLKCGRVQELGDFCSEYFFTSNH